MTKTSATDTVPVERPNSRFRTWVSQRCSPRSAMTLILLATTAVGSIASFLLLHGGVSHFAIRYGLAVLVAYATMLALIGLWARYEKRRFEQQNGLAGKDGVSSLVGSGGGNWSFGSSGGSSSGGAKWSGGGGTSGGGGASASFAGGRAPLAAAAVTSSGDSSASSSTSSSGSHGSGSGFSFDLDGDEIVVVILVVLAVVAAIAAAGYIVWIAPTFLGDVLAASVAGAGISHRVAKPGEDWLTVALKRTVWPAAGVMLVFVIAGAALHHYAPGARTLHDVWRYHLAPKEAP